jgi:hypothetical protein
MKKKKGLSTSPSEQPSTLLPESPGDNPFNVPEGYFDTLPLRIQDRITKLEQPVPVKPSIIRTLPLPVKLAAASALLALVVMAAILLFSKNDATELLEGLSADMIMENPGEVIEIDENYLVETLISKTAEEGLNGITGGYITFTEEEVTEDDIIAYLLSEYSPDDLNLDNQTLTESIINIDTSTQ